MCLGPGLPLELVTRMDVDLARKAMSADGDDQLVTWSYVGMMKRLRPHGLYMSAWGVALYSLQTLVHLCLHPRIHKVECDICGQRTNRRTKHYYGHNSMRIIPAAIMLSPVWQVRQCIVRGQVSINILCLHKTMFLTIFLGLYPWLNLLEVLCVPSLFSCVRILHGLGPKWK